jgi:hypothetical protein
MEGSISPALVRGRRSSRSRRLWKTARLGAAPLMPYLNLKDVGYSGNVFVSAAGERVTD